MVILSSFKSWFKNCLHYKKQLTQKHVPQGTPLRPLFSDLRGNSYFLCAYPINTMLLLLSELLIFLCVEKNSLNPRELHLVKKPKTQTSSPTGFSKCIPQTFYDYLSP